VATLQQTQYELFDIFYAFLILYAIIWLSLCFSFYGVKLMEQKKKMTVEVCGFR